MSNPKTFEIHGVCSQDFYEKAIEYMLKNVIDPHFFVFSDDPEWVSQNFQIDGEYKVVYNEKGSKNYEELYAMSLCKHNIIANSTFSWWGAWLNQNPDKIVIAPKKWFNDITRDSGEIVPKAWIQI